MTGIAELIKRLAEQVASDTERGKSGHPDPDYGVDAIDPESLIMCVLDNGPQGQRVFTELAAAGYSIVPTEALAKSADALEAAVRERDEAREIVAQVNNSVIGSYGWFTTPSCVAAVEQVKRQARTEWLRAEAMKADLEAAERVIAPFAAMCDEVSSMAAQTKSDPSGWSKSCTWENLTQARDWLTGERKGGDDG